MGTDFADALRGDGGANTIWGRDGNDTINGRAGNDVLAGMNGNDSFVFDTALNAATNLDRIADFSVGDDKIVLENAIFTTIIGTTLTEAQFAANASGTAQDADDRIVYETGTGNLFFDSNGNAAGGVTQFAQLAPGLALTNADFLIM